MKRDMDLIRNILFRIEATDNPPKGLDLSFSNHNEQVVAHHVRLLVQANLVTCSLRL